MNDESGALQSAGLCKSGGNPPVVAPFGEVLGTSPNFDIVFTRS
jgi:hypothetical protein